MHTLLAAMKIEGILLIGIPVTIIILLLLRPLVLWYFKINQRIKLQQTMVEATFKILELNGGTVNWEVVKELTENK